MAKFISINVIDNTNSGVAGASQFGEGEHLINVDKIIEDCKYPKLAQNRDELKQVPLYDFLIEHDFKSML